MTRHQHEILKTSTEKRILNEFGSKILNEERLDNVILLRKSGHLTDHSDMPFYCECDDSECVETIAMSTDEYQRMHLRSKYFTVAPSHVRLDLEEIVDSFSTYSLVRKFFPRPKVH
ncbi:MAG: hypothetical protein JWN01_1088 [Patescibacteria group bacterium]|nr:hypothetical protein [Patescibacteria group bacterium]